MIAGDFNARAVEWENPRTDKKDQTLLEAYSLFDVVLVNMDDFFTFSRGSFGSIVDLTFISSNLAKAEIRWEVSKCYTHSDYHQATVCVLHDRL